MVTASIVAVLPLLVAGAGIAPSAQCPDDRPVVSEGACVSEMDAFVSCIRRTAAERSDLSTSDRSDLEGRVQAEVQRLVKVKASVEGVRKVEKNVVSSYSRTGHPGAEVEIAKACLRMATPKRAKRSPPQSAEKKADVPSIQLHDNYGQFNGPGSHDNLNIIGRLPPRDLSDPGSRSALLDGVPSGEKFRIERVSDAESGNFARQVKAFLVDNGRVFENEIIGFDAVWMGVTIFTKQQVQEAKKGDFYLIRIGADDGKRGPSPPLASP
jgi:hypothetical protein